MAASWKADYAGTKTAVATALGAATLAQAISFDPGQPLNASDTVTLQHFAAAIVMAQAGVAALTGPATKVKVVLTGYRDSVVAGTIFTAASKIDVSVMEKW